MTDREDITGQRPGEPNQMDKREPNEQLEGFHGIAPRAEDDAEVARDMTILTNELGAGPENPGIGGRDMVLQPGSGASHGSLADTNARGAGTEVSGGLGAAAGGPGEVNAGSGAGPMATGTSGAGNAPMPDPASHGSGSSVGRDRRGTRTTGGIGENPVDMGGDIGNTGPTGGLETPGT